MPGISIHVVDVSRGIVAARTFAAGRCRAVFDVGGYYRSSGFAIGANPFLELVNFDFGIAVPEQHVHLPFKCTPWGYSCFRGGA